MRSAILLAAGVGSRLRPLTDHVPKCLLPVGGQPIMGHWFALLARHGFGRVLVNTHHMAAQVQEFCETGSHGVDVSVSFEPELLGSAGTIRENRAFVDGADYFAVGYADTYVDASLAQLMTLQERHTPVATLGLFEPPDPRQAGIVTRDASGLIVGFVEKPQNPPSTFAFAGVLLASPELIDRIPERVPCDLGTDVLPTLVGEMIGAEIDGIVCDIGTPDSYAAINARLGQTL